MLGSRNPKQKSLAERMDELDRNRQQQAQNQIEVINRLQSRLKERDDALERVRDLCKDNHSVGTVLIDDLNAAIVLPSQTAGQ